MLNARKGVISHGRPKQSGEPPMKKKRFDSGVTASENRGDDNLPGAILGVAKPVDDSQETVGADITYEAFLGNKDGDDLADLLEWGLVFTKDENRSGEQSPSSVAFFSDAAVSAAAPAKRKAKLTARQLARSGSSFSFGALFELDFAALEGDIIKNDVDSTVTTPAAYFKDH